MTILLLTLTFIQLLKNSTSVKIELGYLYITMCFFLPLWWDPTSPTTSTSCSEITKHGCPTIFGQQPPNLDSAVAKLSSQRVKRTALCIDLLGCHGSRYEESSTRNQWSNTGELRPKSCPVSRLNFNVYPLFLQKHTAALKH